MQQLALVQEELVEKITIMFAHIQVFVNVYPSFFGQPIFLARFVLKDAIFVKDHLLIVQSVLTPITWWELYVYFFIKQVFWSIQILRNLNQENAAYRRMETNAMKLALKAANFFNQNVIPPAQFAHQLPLR